MPGEYDVDLRHRGETPCKYPPLQGECSSHYSFIGQQLRVRVNLKLAFNAPPVWLSEAGVGTGAGAPDVESELSASSDEADAAAVVGVGTSAEPEASSDHDTPKEPNAPSSFVRSSSDWEAVTTPYATFLGVALAACADRDGVEVPGGTYSGSHSSSEPMTKRADGATDFDRPRT